jgi:hypothetical protein
MWEFQITHMTYELLNSDYKTLHEVVQDFPFYKSVKTLKRALDKKGIPTEKRGRTVVIKKIDVCAFFVGNSQMPITTPKSKSQTSRKSMNQLLNPAIAKKINNQLYERKL